MSCTNEMTAPATEAHKLHMLNLSRITTTQGRREYIEAVQRAEGKFSAKWLRDDLSAQFQAKQGARV